MTNHSSRKKKQVEVRNRQKARRRARQTGLGEQSGRLTEGRILVGWVEVEGQNLEEKGNNEDSPQSKGGEYP